ncbi:MAG: SatD family protein [Gammaproteobacteria bacterium]|nr:SatD family protein [Gammaproteobacteria bacterium]
MDTRKAAIIADVRSSRKIKDFVALRDRKLAWASSKHLSLGLIQAPYAVTVWDEFQTLTGRARDVPRILFDLHHLFQPLSLWIGIGIGEVTGLPAATGGRSLSDVAGGEAFLLARDSINRIKERRTKYLRMTAFKSADLERDELLGHVYGLHDTLLLQITPSQWRTIDALLETGQQDEAAQKLGISPSTVSRNLRRAHYWQLLETQDMAAKLLSSTT